MKIKSLSWLLAVGVGCSGDKPVEPPPPPDEFTTLWIVTNTGGPEPDPDGYVVEVAGRSLPLGSADSIALTDIPPGQHEVELSGEDANCRIAPSRVQSVGLALNRTNRVEFDVNCKAALRDRILFTSDEFGNRDIFSINPDGTDLRRITEFPGNEFSIGISPDRTQISFSSEMAGPSDIFVMDIDGSNLRNLTANSPGAQGGGDWSPDGSQIVYRSTQAGGFEIYVMNSDGTNKRRLTNHPDIDQMPHWSPDGSRIAFQSQRDSLVGVYTVNSDGTNLQLVTSPFEVTDWSPDGETLAGVGLFPSLNREIVIIDLATHGVVQISLNRSSDDRARWNADGTQMVFESNRGGANGPDIYVMESDGSNVRQLTDRLGIDCCAVWSNP